MGSIGMVIRIPSKEIARSLLILLAAWTGVAAQESKPVSAVSPTTAQPSIDRFMKMKWPSRADLAPDGTLYFIFDPDGIYQLYQVLPGKTQKNAVKLTNFPDGISNFALSDDGKWIVAVAAVGGSEQDDLYLLETERGQIEPLLVNPKFVYESPLWRRDSKAFAYRSNDSNPSDFHVYVCDLDNKQFKKIYAGSGDHTPVDFTKDGGKLMILKYTSASFSQLFEITLSNGESREVTPKSEEWSFEPIGYSADERTFLVNTDYRGDLKAVHSIDLASGKIERRLSDLDGREIDYGTLNQERTVLGVVVNEDGYAALHLRNASDYKPMPGPPLAKGIVGNIRFQGQQMLYALDNANTPGLIHRWTIGDAKSPGTALTLADTQGIDVAKFRLPELVNYESFDGAKVPAFLFLPADFKKGAKIPFLVQYHGGPEGQFRSSFNRAFQHFVSRGFGVIVPNVRGSSGYGKAYVEADNYKNRMVSVKDGIWAAKYVIDQGYTEKNWSQHGEAVTAAS